MLKTNKTYSFFKFLEEKRGRKFPLKYKLVHAPEELTEEDLDVEGDLDLSGIKITSLPDNTKVSRGLYLGSTKITHLPDNLKVGRDLDLSATPIKHLPDNLEIRRNLYLGNTLLTSIPYNLKIRESLFLFNTPLSRKYTGEEITKMIEGRRGFVKEGIPDLI